MPQTVELTIGDVSEFQESWYVESVSATATVLGRGVVFLCDATSAAFTITLPDVSVYEKRVLVFKKTDGTANAVTIDGAGADTIDGATTQVLATQYDTIMISSNGTSWDII